MLLQYTHSKFNITKLCGLKGIAIILFPKCIFFNVNMVTHFTHQTMKNVGVYKIECKIGYNFGIS